MFPKSSGPHSGAKWFVIVNPVAGGGRGLDHFPQISKHLRDAHIRCEPVFTEHKFHATELTVTAVREGYRHIIVVGGDGTLHEVVNGLFIQQEVRPDEVLLAVVALGVPAVYFWTFFHSLRLQIKKMGLPRPFYRLLLDDEGLSVWMAGEQDKPEASRKYAWHDMHLAYRTPNAIYLYVRQNQAYLLNDSLDAAWSLLQASLPAERLHDMR